jgi:predicted phage terminase large subunit-like protein
VQRHTQEKWDLLSFPAVAEEPQTFTWATLLGEFKHHRAIGDVLHPKREPLEQHQIQRASLGEYHYASQYQQNPAPLGGGMVKEEWFKRYRPNELPGKFDLILQSWDTANKASELSDHSVCTTWGQKDKRNYLLNVWRKQVDYPSLKRAVQQQRDLYPPSVILIEDRGSGTQLIQELRATGVSAVTPYKSSLDKVMRFAAQTGVVESGLVYLPEQAHWLAEYLHELKTFPKARYDDQVDSTSQALEWLSLKNRHPAWAFMEAQKILAAQAAKVLWEEEEEVELIGPPGTTLYPHGKPLRMVGVDGRIMVPKFDVPGLLQQIGWKRA